MSAGQPDEPDRWERERVAQGLPPTITDETVLRLLAALVARPKAVAHERAA